MEILKLISFKKETIWGGDKLKKSYGKKTNIDRLGETWECSAHPNGMSIVANGRFKNKTLVYVLEHNTEYLGTKLQSTKELPILVKFIDAKDDLSVQVHPDDAYARKYENQNGKTEMWYVMDADDDAHLIYGFEHPVTKKILQEAIKTGDLDKHLHKVNVKKGDTYFMPAGTVHGIGAGNLIAEIQQSSDVTYRVYDYNRLDKDGKARELHFDKAVEVMKMNPSVNTKPIPRLIHYYPTCSREVLCSCKYFITEKIITKHGFAFSVLDTSFQVILCLEGEGTIEIGNSSSKPLHFKKGDCMFIPANAGRCYLFGKTTLLKIRC